MKLTAPIHSPIHSPIRSPIRSKMPSFALIVGLVGGLLAGQFFTARTMQVAEAASQERQLAALQSARGAMNLIKYDMERAGYVETSPMSHATFEVHFGQVRSGAGSDDVLQLTQAKPQSLLFRSPDGRATIEYRCEGTRLSRIAAGRESEHVLLLANALHFQIRQRADGSTLNIAFAIPMSGNESRSVLRLDDGGVESGEASRPAGASNATLGSQFVNVPASQSLVMAHFVRSVQ